MICLAAIIGGAIFACAELPEAPPAPIAPTEETVEPKDVTAPVITEVSTRAVAREGAVITWATDEPATSQVAYGLTAACISATTPDKNTVTGHTVILSGLNASTTYNFKVKSKDAAGNESVSPNYTLVTSYFGTLVGGTISGNTTWTEGESPYIITGTVQVPAGMTLTIEPGTSALMRGSDDYMFRIYGTVVARGTASSKITFDGGMHSFFSCENASPEASVDLDHCVIKNGASLINFARCFYLGHSEVTNLTQCSDISFGTTKDVYIEYNRFTNASGFYTGGGARTYVRYNYFNTPNRTVREAPWITNRSGPPTIINNNFFLNTDGIAVMLEGGKDSQGMVATNNYWGTLNLQIIDTMIWDKNDDSSLGGYIEYLPIRTSPEPIRLLIF